jgi:hypothetical protein
VLRTNRLRADTTVIPADVAYPTDSGLLAKAVGTLARTARRVSATGAASRTYVGDRRRAVARRVRQIAGKLGSRGTLAREKSTATIGRVTGELVRLAETAPAEAQAVLRTGRRGCGGSSTDESGASCIARWTSWPPSSNAPAGSPPGRVPGCPGRPPRVRPGRSACTTRTPGRSARRAHRGRSPPGQDAGGATRGRT